MDEKGKNVNHRIVISLPPNNKSSVKLKYKLENIFVTLIDINGLDFQQAYDTEKNYIK